MSRDAFLRGTVILAAGGLISRGLGVVYRFLLPVIMGAQATVGMGLFNYAYSVYILLLGISTSGFPNAVAKLVAEHISRGEYRNAHSVFRLSFYMLSVLGLVFSVALYYLAPLYATYVADDPRATKTLQAVAPAVFFVSTMSAYRGYFQGLHRMGPTAVSQVIEQLVRITTMLVLAGMLLPRGIEFSAAGATFGAVTGAVVGLIYLQYEYVRSGRRPVPPAGENAGETVEDKPGPALEVMRRVLVLTIPISLVGIVQPISGVLDSFLVPLRLRAAGFMGEEATALYGVLTGYALPFIIAPTVFSVALATSLVPSISEASARKDIEAVRRRSNTGIRATLLLTVPAAAGLLALAGEIPVTVFTAPEAGLAGLPLAILALGSVFLGLQQASSSVLYGLGAVMVPVRGLLLGAVVKLVITWGLTAIVSVNINGAALGTTAGFLAAAWLNLRSLQEVLGYRLSWTALGGKVFLSSVVMAIATRGVYLLLAGSLGLKPATLVAIAAGAVIYPVLLVVSGGLTARDLEMLPGIGPRLVTVLRRHELIRG